MTELRSTRDDREFDKFDLNSDEKTAVRTVGETTITNAIVPGYSSFIYTDVDITDDSWTALPPSPAANRSSVGIQNRSGSEIKFFQDPDEPTYKGWSIINLGEFFMDVKDGAVIYAKSANGPRTIGILELIE